MTAQITEAETYAGPAGLATDTTPKADYRESLDGIITNHSLSKRIGELVGDLCVGYGMGGGSGEEGCRWQEVLEN